MTREEAIYWLDHHDLDKVKFFTAVGYAIKALKAERPRGVWIDRGHNNIFMCSECKEMWMGVGGYNFCPHCGADMRGEEDGKIS